MIRLWAIVSLLAFLPGLAFAQDGLGLDLSDNASKEEKTEEAPPPRKSTPAPTSTPVVAEPEPKKGKPELGFGERDITQEDRVKSVQRKVYLKKNRFELAPSVGISVNDPFYVKASATVRGAYYLADTLAVAVRGSYFQNIRTDDVKTANAAFQSRIFHSNPYWSALADLEWSPVYGKVAIFNSILHFDAYLLGGLGMVVTETSSIPGRPAGDLGLGLRFVVRDFLAVNVAGINTSYVDTPTGTNKGSTQNMFTLNAGISIFIPFSSTGREAE